MIFSMFLGLGQIYIFDLIWFDLIWFENKTTRTLNAEHKHGYFCFITVFLIHVLPGKPALYLPYRSFDRSKEIH